RPGTAPAHHHRAHRPRDHRPRRAALGDQRPGHAAVADPHQHPRPLADHRPGPLLPRPAARRDPRPRPPHSAAPAARRPSPPPPRGPHDHPHPREATVKRRHLLAAVPLAALPLAALAACDPSTTEPSAAPASPVEDPTPVLRGERAEVVAPATLRLPLELTPKIVVDPGWAATPRQLACIFLGYADDGAQLAYRAGDQDGSVLW